MKSLLARVLGGEAAVALPSRISTSLSDDQAYPQVCVQAANDYRFFNQFRRNPVYNRILEHVSETQGGEYLRLLSGDPEILAGMERFKANDRHGGPLTYEYPGVGVVSPSTLRYVKVLADLKAHFRTLDGLDVCEIGVGYGGQCRVINAHYQPATYRLVDIRPALLLAQRFLDHYAIPSVLTYQTMNELPRQSFDLVISNYAFTELPRAIQDVYLAKVIAGAKRGYITYNEINPTEFGSYRAAELIEMIPGSVRRDEVPLTHPNNCVIVWGTDA